MRKIIIMSVAVISSLVCGEALMAMVFGFVMVTGLMAGCFMGEAARQIAECPASAFRPLARKLEAPVSK